MDPEFWHSRWQAGQIGFHEGRVNRMLAAHIGALDLATGARLFLPLCGKTVDIHWLLSEGYRVTGIELSEIAVRELFDEIGAAPEISQVGSLKLYAGRGLDIFVGDIFALTAGMLGSVDAVYDRAALVALPEGMRGQYAAQVAGITGTAPQLLITFEYDQTLMDGPPFSLSEAAVRTHYGARYAVSVLSSRDVEGGLKGICPATEKALLLTPA
jgi:thiopurine S-methyltransferase